MMEDSITEFVQYINTAPSKEVLMSAQVLRDRRGLQAILFKLQVGVPVAFFKNFMFKHNIIGWRRVPFIKSARI